MNIMKNLFPCSQKMHNIVHLGMSNDRGLGVCILLVIVFESWWFILYYEVVLSQLLRRLVQQCFENDGFNT